MSNSPRLMTSAGDTNSSEQVRSAPDAHGHVVKVSSALANALDTP
ncbi:hypothetical protein [Streptomyces sp. V2]|nr:hypothetical protein [Streptomyces sp. V2]